MKDPKFIAVVCTVLFSSLMLVLGLYFLAKFSRLFKQQIKNELLRKNIVVWVIATCFLLSLTPTYHDFFSNLSSKVILHYFILQIAAVTLEALFVFNITWFVLQYTYRKDLSFRKRNGIVLFTIILSTMLIGFPVNYIASGSFINDIQYRLIYNFYMGGMTGLVYVTMSYLGLERKKKLDEKELEIIRLQQLKTKAELDALHSKINPHFLYNALNSIADLSITDGRKARRMTVALADLFRYSINYNDHNYSSIKEEVEMAAVYLEIEKIRFEDKLNYTIHIEDEISHCLVPRFVLQPVVENAVKHGLKVTGRMTEISIEVKKEGNGLELIVADNGPAFPDELIPGYGVKSMYDKLDLLFPNNYEVHFSNEPHKQVSIFIYKLLKNEPSV